jgi:hypothetical protein
MNSIYTEYANLSEANKQWLDGCGMKWCSGHIFSLFKSNNVSLEKECDGGWCFKRKASGDKLVTGDEFCQRVADILGIDEPTFDYTLAGAPVASPEEMAQYNEPIYPHKVYRVLDSLDGIPLDTRIPLSEWIPPQDKDVLIIIKDHYFVGTISGIRSSGMSYNNKFEGGSYAGLGLDGHWMRIV